MVRPTGLEPVRCYSLEPESSASANSATGAYRPSFLAEPGRKCQGGDESAKSDSLASELTRFHGMRRAVSRFANRAVTMPSGIEPQKSGDIEQRFTIVHGTLERCHFTPLEPDFALCL